MRPCCGARRAPETPTPWGGLVVSGAFGGLWVLAAGFTESFH